MFAAFSGVAVVAAIAILIAVGKIVAGALMLLAGALTIFAVCLHQAIDFSPAVIARLESFAKQAGGRFTPWKAGVGDNTAVPFAEGGDTARFGVVNYQERGLPLEIGHLSTRKGAGLRKITAYVAIRLPRRMPHMAIDFGHLSNVFGVRVMPTSWHRAQRLDVGAGRRFPLFVTDDGERRARAFFAPEVVRAFIDVGRSYDVEIKRDRIYLFSRRSIASGSDRRFRRQQALIEALVASLTHPQVSDRLDRSSRGRADDRAELRTDVKRGVIIVCAALVAVIVVASVVTLYAQGLLEF